MGAEPKKSTVRSICVNVREDKAVIEAGGTMMTLTIADAIEIRKTLDRYLPYHDDEHNLDVAGK